MDRCLLPQTEVYVYMDYLSVLKAHAASALFTDIIYSKDWRGNLLACYVQ